MNRVAALSTGVALILLVAAGSLLPAADPEALDRPDTRWRRGPVKYLLSRDEASEYKKLKSDEDRQAYIADFWARRDPTPGTEANEFKEQYAGRLAMVEERFAAPEGRGWEEDRGMVILLLGPPDEIQMIGPGDGGGDTAGADTAAAPVGGPGAAPAAGPAPRRRATFVYKREIFPGGPTPAELEFVETSSGGFRLVTKADLSDPRLTGLEPLPHLIASAQPQATEPEPGPEGPGAADASLPPPEPEPAPPPPPTPQEELMAEVLSEPAPESRVEILTRFDFYKTQEADTFATLTVAFEQEGEAEPAPIIAARLLDENDEIAVSLESEGSFAPAEEDGAGATDSEVVYQAGHNVPPGKYSVVTAVKDPASGMLGYRQGVVEIPDFTQEALQISSVTLARKIENMQGAPGGTERFVLGNYKVIPAPNPVFRAGQDLILYYQVYNTAADPESGRPKLKVSYQFEKVEATRKIPLGREPITQDANTAVQAYGITIAPVWPEGDYQVEVKVEDLVAGATAAAVVPFQVKKEG